MPAAFAISSIAASLAAGGYAYAAMWPTSKFFGSAIIAGRDPGEIALTYDDGPNDRCTQELLEVLARHQVRATFFLIGKFVRQRPDLARAIQAAGHLVGNHTMTHPMLLFQPPRRVREQLAGCNAALEDALGEPVRYFRPPHGARRPDVLRVARELGLKTVLWNVTARDWRPHMTTAMIEANIQKGIRRNRRHGRGSNLLLHDGGHAGIGQNRGPTVAATRNLLEQAQNIKFVTVDAWG